MENAYLVLGCFGRTDDGFVSCPSIENRILKLDDSLVYLDDMMDYFESVQLFDKPMLDWNAICHLVYNLQDRFDQKIKRLWTEKEYHLLERFMQMHRQCGLYTKLIVVPEEMDIPAELEPDSLTVKGSPEIIQKEKKPELKLVRGKR